MTTKQQTIYVACDGKEFNNEEVCKGYEKERLDVKVAIDYMQTSEFLKNDVAVLRFIQYLQTCYSLS